MEFSLNRRSFIKAMGGAGIASLLACNNDPVKRIVSHLTPQQELTPGVVTWFASVCRECPAGCGIVVGCMEGRPIKVEGNPLHPVNRGALCARGQAALQGLYNPDRPGEPFKRGDGGSLESVTWGLALGQLSDKLSELRKADALDRVAMITPHLPSSLSSLLDAWVEENPGIRLVEYEPISYESIEKANEFCFDRNSLPVYRLEDADLVVSFGADFLETWISPVEYASAFARMRTYSEGKIGRLLYVGSRQSLTAANADETVMIKPGGYGAITMGMIRVMLEENLRESPATGDARVFEKLTRGFDPDKVYEATGVAEDRLRDLARVVAGSRRSVILPGGVESSSTNATENIISVNILNYFLGNYGERINILDRDPYPRRNNARDFSLLVDKMARGDISLALFYGVNPAYSVPSPSNVLGALDKVETVVCCSDVFNETTEVCDYLLPVHAPMESWGDCSPRDGVRGLMQPVVRPLGDSKHFGEVLIELSRSAGDGSPSLAGFGSYYEFLVDAWRGIAKAAEPEKPFREFWEDALRKGGHFEDSESSQVRLSARVSSFDWKSTLIESLDKVQSQQSRNEKPDAEDASLVVYPSQIHYDGRGANKPWLQELQDPMLQNVWGNYIEVSGPMAERMGVETGDVLKLTSPYSSIEGPAHVSDRMQSDVVAISMGQGHTRFGQFADKTGVNPVRLLPWSFDEMSGQGAYLTVNVKLEKTGRRDALPTPEGNPYDEGRGIAQVIGLGALRDLTREEQHGLPHDDEEAFEELLSPHDHPRHRWGW